MLLMDQSEMFVGRDHELTFKRVGEQGLSVNAMGERAYDNLILFAPTSNGMSSIASVGYVFRIDSFAVGSART
jgi:hypothetical protein